MTQPFDLQAFGIHGVTSEHPADLGERLRGSTKLEQEARPPPLRGQHLGVVHDLILPKIGEQAAEGL